jgi:hypothetical protein
MIKITTTHGLKIEIQKLDEELVRNRNFLKDQLIATYEIFKPVNLVKNALKKYINPSFLMDKLMGPVLGLAAGYLFRK